MDFSHKNKLNFPPFPLWPYPLQVVVSIKKKNQGFIKKLEYIDIKKNTNIEIQKYTYHLLILSLRHFFKQLMCKLKMTRLQTIQL